jgi:integrase
MRVGEVLNLTPADILDRKLILNDTKCGNEQELIFITQKVADRLKEYVRVQKIAVIVCHALKIGIDNIRNFNGS